MASRTDIQWSVDRFNKFLDRFIKHTNIAAPLVLKKFAADALTRIVARTPVDTGDARGGWMAAGRALGVRVPRPGARAKIRDEGEYEEQLTGNRMFIRIANNIPYIIYLEYGWSKQAPLGMVRITLAELRTGNDLSQDMMEELQAAWAETSGRSRYRANRRIMGGVLRVQDMELTRRRKPNVTRRPR